MMMTVKRKNRLTPTEIIVFVILAGMFIFLIGKALHGAITTDFEQQYFIHDNHKRTQKKDV